VYAKFGAALVKYLKARLAGFGTAVRPSAAPPDDVPPYVSWERTDYRPGGQHDERDGKQGMGGFYDVTVEIVVWDTDRVRADQVVDKIVGTTADPGLLGWRKWLPTAADPGRVAVQSCALADDPSDGMALPPDGSETRWYSTTIPLLFRYTE
jgi:hypothetical protein